MLFLLFQLGHDRYALEANRVVEVLPLLELKRPPQAPAGLAGVFNYRGRPVPAVDLCELALGQRAAALMSTRIIVISFRGPSASCRLLGLVAENATEMIRKDAKDFVEPAVKVGAAPYLGPVMMDPQGRPIQLLRQEHLLSEPIQQLLFREPLMLEPINQPQATLRSAADAEPTITKGRNPWLWEQPRYPTKGTYR